MKVRFSVSSSRGNGMTKICIVCLVHGNFEIVANFERALAQLKVDAEIVIIPHFFLSGLTKDRFHSLTKLLKDKSSEAFVVFFPDSTELFLGEADFMVVFSAYRSWFNKKKMRVIPHLWTPVALPDNVDDLTWKEKPPFRIGFMGRSHATSRLASFTLQSPGWIKKWLLRGSFLRHANLIAQLNELGISIQFINAFPRIETIRLLHAMSQNHNIAAELDIVEQGLGGSEQDKIDYRNHLKRNTYIICPRGTEN